MGTALAVTQQQSIELADPSWARIHNTDRCPRCSGLMVAEWCQDLSDYTRSALRAMWRDHRSGHSAESVGALQGTMDHSAMRENTA